MAVTRRTHVAQKHASHHKNVSKFVRGRKHLKVTARGKKVGHPGSGNKKHRNTKSFMHP
jgi:hypothetical protein